MAAPVALPPQFGRYRILQSLGAGGMGTVYLAEDTVLSRKVAIKVPHFTAADSPVIRERFLREARAAAAIDHPNLCSIYDTGVCDGIHFLVMPYIDGKPLSRLVDEEHPWPPEQALALVRKLALALQVLHDGGLIHRDLKPSNVMIRPNGEPVIMDFGLAKSLTNQSRQLTKLGAVLGTPAYMSPEQVLGEVKRLGPASDVYSLGVIFYELLTGQLPFEGPPAAVCAQILHANPEAPSARRAELEPWLDSVCLKALAKKLDQRYATMTDFVHALQAPPPMAATIYTTDSGSNLKKATPQAQTTDELPWLTESGQLEVDELPWLTESGQLELEELPLITASRQAEVEVMPLDTESEQVLAHITCPKCSKKLKVPARAAGKKLFCPRCQAKLRGFARPLETRIGLLPTIHTMDSDTDPRNARSEPQVEQHEGRPRETVAAQPSITCPKCSKILKVPSGVEGKKLFCPRCQTNLT